MKVLVVGGGKVGTFITKELAGSGHSVTVVEQDPSRVDEVASVHGTSGAVWQTADGCEVDALKSAGIEEADVVVAVTGDDEDNLVVSLLSKVEFGVPRVIARINNPDNEWLFNEAWGVDVAVSTPHLLTALVEEAVSVGSLVRLLSFDGGRVRLSEITLADDAKVVGQQLAELQMPRDSTVVAVVRDERVIVPRGDTALAAGDEVLVLVSESDEPDVRTLLS